MNARTTLLAIGFSSVALLPLFSQQQPSPAASKPADPKADAKKYLDREDYEIKRPDGFDDQEWRILHSLDSLSIDRMTQLLQVYERLGNTAMLDALTHAILQRDPSNKDAQRVRDGGQTEEVVRPAGYLEDLAKKVMRGEKVSDPDSVPVQAVALVAEGRPEEAVTLLERLRANQFKGDTFPYLDDLAFVLGEAGRYDESEAAYKAVIADPKMPEESIIEARAALPHATIKKRIYHIQLEAGADGSRLVAASAKMLTEHLGDEDVQEFHISALQSAQRYPEAVKFLLKMRESYTGKATWPWLPELGFSYFGARDYDKAIAIFREIQKSPDMDDKARNEATTAILEIQVSRQIEDGMIAMQRGDLKHAGEVLESLERDYKSHRDVLGYRASYLAKTGRSDQALQELEAKRASEVAQHLSFSQQDALVDVYLERKDFAKAREAALLIVNDGRYDPDMRQQAMKSLEDVEVAELQDRVSTALQNGHRVEARHLAEEMRRTKPARIETRMVEAEVALAYFNAEYARRELLALKSAPYPQGFQGMPFDSQNSLASAQAMAGDWEGAYQSYGEVLDAQPFVYEAEDVWEARWERRELLSWFRPTFSLAVNSTTEDEGSQTTSTWTYQTAWQNDWRFGVFGRSSTTKLKKGSLFYDGGDVETQFEGGITAMHRFKNNYFIEAMVGGSQDDVMYGVHFGKLAYGTFGWSLGFVGNALSTDSVSLQALNGRENRAEFKIAGPITDRVNVDFNAWYQWNRVGGSRLGEGYGASGSVDYVIQTETRRRPELSIGYAFDYSRFEAASTLPPRIRSEIRRAEAASPEVRKALGANEEVRRALAGNFGSEVFDSLVDPYTNRHGLVFKARKHFDNKLALSAEIGAYYAFDEDSVGFTGAVGAEYWLSETSMIYAELRYDSNGKGASSNGGVWEANIGGQMSF